MRNRDEIKELSIKEKALQMIVKDGFDGFSMQKLAKQAKVSPATIYIYFQDKEALILQLYQEENDKMISETLKNFDPKMCFSEGLKIQWRNRSQYYMQNQEQMFFLEQIKHSSLHYKAMLLVGESFKSIMKEFLHTAIEKKELVPVPMEVYWSLAFAPLYSLVRFHTLSLNSNHHQFTFTEEIMDQTLQIVLKGLKP